ncbi:MAG: class I SAM-dependent methyltransferase [Sulfuritalea sp.]|nr:class I SAM-dependent methyltransferase [Sulfuritalea sp.]
MNNYEFCAQWILGQEHGKNVHVLDYGCGAGAIVKELRSRGINAFGCDVFYEGGDSSTSIEPTLLDGAIRRMSGSAIPFESASFEFVINNQVMEHVENLDNVLAEIQRILKPGGKILSLFPDKGVWREGHCGVPFLHWFPKGSRSRVYYAAACRTLGLGYFKGNKSIMRWSQDFCEWLDTWTHYRTQGEIELAYKKYFCDVTHIEDYWLQQRLGRRKIIATWLPASTQKLVVRKLAGLIFVARKPV